MIQLHVQYHSIIISLISESDNNQVAVVNDDTNSKSTPAQFQLNLSGM